MNVSSDSKKYFTLPTLFLFMLSLISVLFLGTGIFLMMQYVKHTESNTVIHDQIVLLQKNDQALTNALRTLEMNQNTMNHSVTTLMHVTLTPDPTVFQQLDNLLSLTPKLIFVQTVFEPTDEFNVTQNVDNNAPLLKRVQHKILSCLKYFVRISPPNTARDKVFFTPEKMQLIPLYLTTELQTAQFALLSHNTLIYKISLNRCKLWVSQYAALHDPNTTTFLTTLTALQNYSPDTTSTLGKS